MGLERTNDWLRRLIVIAALHIRYVFAAGSGDVNLNIIPALTIESVQLGYALISATIPNLKSFLMSFDTGMMMDVHAYRSHSHSHSQSHSNSGSKSLSTFGLRSYNSSKTARRLTYSGACTQDELICRLRPDWERLEHRADAHHVSDAEAEIEHLPSSSERESQDRGIRVDFQWSVDEEEKSGPSQPHGVKR